ncbi:MAG: FAD:protein FMN transferase [Planctomycetaceae bacterium]|nr:FAD:protein FMN transferase [Planctomycetaceae bacterium]
MVDHMNRCLFGMAAALLGLGPEPGPTSTRFEYAETHMSSHFRIVLYTDREETARSASRAAFARIAELDAALSDYQPDSELARLCGQAGGPPAHVGADLFDVLARSRAMSERSGGAFDVTVGPVVRLWRRARRDRKMPAPERLAGARALVGYEALRLDPEARTVRLLKPGMKLDVGGIAKGYAGDEAIRVLKRHGIDRALVAGGGDIVVSGPPPGRDGWSIGIASLEPSRAAPSRFIALRDAAISTAGDAERYVEIDGRRYSHIIDPWTGLGVVDRCGVTVVARDGATADSLDTAVYVLGPERGLPLVEATQGAAALIIRSIDATVQIFESRRWREIPQAGPE